MWKRIDRACGETARGLNEYLDGTLPPRQRRVIEAHLQLCAACRSELNGMRDTLALLAGLPARELPDEFETELRKRLAGMPASRVSTRAILASMMSGTLSPEPWLHAPWPSPLRRLAPIGAVAAAAVALLFVKLAPVPQIGRERPPVPAYVKAMVREHQMLNAGADMNATVVGHNLNGDILGEGDEE
jgi:anti-sigma factor RsiW